MALLPGLGGGDVGLMQQTKVRRSSRTPLIAAGAGAAVLAVLTVGVVIGRHDGSNSTVAIQPAAQVSTLQQGCRQWLAQDPASTQAPSWCTGLTGWMSERMGASGMGPAMMWGGPDQMRATCRQWVSAAPSAASTDDPASACDSMVAWMSGHTGTWTGRSDWNGWMMNGPMMGHSGS